jgi:hypothetical protein
MSRTNATAAILADKARDNICLFEHLSRLFSTL